jgi:hypothetical protein
MPHFLLLLWLDRRTASTENQGSVLLLVSFFAARKDSPCEDSFSPWFLEFGIWNLRCAYAALCCSAARQ